MGYERPIENGSFPRRLKGKVLEAMRVDLSEEEFLKMNLRAGNASLKRHLIVGSAWGGCIIWYFNTNNPLAALCLLALFAGGIGWAIGYRDKEDEDPGGFQEFVNGFEMGVREVKNKGQANADALVAMYRQQQERERSLRR